MSGRITTRDRVIGGLIGLAVGDALGVPVEHEPREARAADPVAGMRAGGVWLTEMGTWSDDTALPLCLADSIASRGFDPEDAGRRSVAWLDEGLWSARGSAFGGGGSTLRALEHIRSGLPAVMAGGRGENDNGNGSLMRILPASIWLASLPERARFRAVAAYSSYTHGHPRSVMGCWLHCLVAGRLLGGERPREAYLSAMEEARGLLDGLPRQIASEAGTYRRVLDGEIAGMDESELRGSGYVVHCLESSLYCLVSTEDYASCALAAVNLGDDADTTGAVAGGLAGLAYGSSSIPRDWVSALARSGEIADLAGRLAGLVEAPAPLPRSYWVLPGKLLAGGHPLRGGPEGVEALLGAGRDAFVDLTAPGEDSSSHHYSESLRRPGGASGREVEYRSVPISDMSAEGEPVERALAELDSLLATGRSVYLHCLGGFGRTGTVVGSFLVEKGLAAPNEAIGLIAALRASTDSPDSASPQTEEQARMIRERRPGPGALPL